MAEKKYRSIDEVIHDGRPLRKILDDHKEFVRCRNTEGTHGESGIRAQLHEADLSNLDLKDAWLHYADLSDAKLIGAELSGVLFYSANLSGTDLSECDLRSNNSLIWVNLSKTKLVKANLWGSRLQQTKLSRADLTSAVMGLTVLADCDLSEVGGLETVEHLEPSSIGVDTIIRSQGKIPEAFLRGVGVPEQFIRYALDLRNNPIEYYKCFIAHADEDIEFAKLLESDLRNRGVGCWFYPRSARAGRGVQEQIGRAIEHDCDKVIVICSRNSLNSSGVIDEIERAIQREDAEKRRDILVSIRIDEYVFGKWDNQDWEAAYKARLKSKHIEDFRDWQNSNKYGSALDRLLQELNRQQANES